DAVSGGALRQLAAPAAGRAARHHWLVAGERAQRSAHALEYPVRLVLHSQLLVMAGLENPVEDAVGGAARAGGVLSAQAVPAAPDDLPLVKIRPSRGWSTLNLRDVWHYRDLVFFLAWRDVQVRYKQTVLGVAWVVVQPLVTTLVFTIIFGNLARIPS